MNVCVFAQENNRAPGAVLLPSEAALDLLKLFPDSLKSKMLFSESDPERTNWYYIPHERKGLPLGEMDKAQNASTFQLIRSCVSEAGYLKIAQICTLLEPMLKELEHRKPEDHFRDGGKYYLSIFGKPSSEQIWGWRFEGHHISCNFLLKGNHLISSTPFFLGSNPARVPEGPHKGREVLHHSIADAFELIHSFNAVQLKKARTNDVAPVNSIEGHAIGLVMPEPTGISLDELEPAQRKLFWNLVAAYTVNFKPEFGASLLEAMEKAGNHAVWFSWKGGLSQGRLYYYRIQSPDILIEHDNTQNDGNHVHSLVRSKKGDFGLGL